MKQNKDYTNSNLKVQGGAEECRNQRGEFTGCGKYSAEKEELSKQKRRLFYAIESYNKDYMLTNLKACTYSLCVKFTFVLRCFDYL